MSGKTDLETPSEKRTARGIRIFLALSIPVYLAAAVILYLSFPTYVWLALIPGLFAFHSAYFLVMGVRVPAE